MASLLAAVWLLSASMLFSVSASVSVIVVLGGHLLATDQCHYSDHSGIWFIMSVPSV